MDYLQYFLTKYAMDSHLGFKPCYKWITFNTRWLSYYYLFLLFLVLNLVINGLPSIHMLLSYLAYLIFRFKPCYKWITFNTEIN